MENHEGIFVVLPILKESGVPTMNLIIFITIGMIAGWISNILGDEPDPGGALEILAGIAGSVFGGYALTIWGITTQSFWQDVGVSVLFSVFFLVIAVLVFPRRQVRQEVSR
jgi:uncharacterized membrane protein YeaQ/YmgE (transglycosylase-associated protein family)